MRAPLPPYAILEFKTVRASPWMFPVALVCFSSSAWATNPGWPNTDAGADLSLPQNWPDDPDYGYLQLGTCPSGPDAGQLVWRPHDGYWNFWSFYPPDTQDPCGDPTYTPWTLGSTLNPSERQSMRGPGMSVDVGWTVTTGDP